MRTTVCDNVLIQSGERLHVRCAKRVVPREAPQRREAAME